MTSVEIYIVGDSDSWTINNTDYNISTLDLKIAPNSIQQSYFQTMDNNSTPSLRGIEVGDSVFISIDGNQVFSGYINNIDKQNIKKDIYTFFMAPRAIEAYKIFAEDTTFEDLDSNTLFSSLISYIPNASSSLYNAFSLDLDQYDTKGRLVGKCLDELSQLTSNLYYAYAPNSSNALNTTFYFYKPSGVISTIQDTDILNYKISHKGTGYKITDVNIIGGYGVLYRYNLTDTSLSDPNIMAEVFEKPSGVSALGKIKITYTITNADNSTCDFSIKVLPLLTNISQDMNLSQELSLSILISGSLANIRDQNSTSYAEYNISSGGGGVFFTFTLKDDNNNDKTVEIPLLYLKFSNNKKINLNIKDVTTGVFITNEDYEAGEHEVLIRVMSLTGKIAVNFQNLTIDDVNLKVNEIAIFSPGYRSGRWAIPDYTKINSANSKSFQITKSSTGDFTKTLEFNYSLLNYDYWTILLYHTDNNIEIYNGNSNEDSPSYTKGYIYITKDGFPVSSFYPYDITMTFTLLGNITYKQTSTANKNKRFVYEIYNSNITDIAVAQSLASQLINSPDKDFRGTFVIQGDSTFDELALLKKIHISSNRLSLDDDYDIYMINHVIDKKHGYLTKLTVGAPPWSIDSKIAMLENQLKSKMLL